MTARRLDAYRSVLAEVTHSSGCPLANDDRDELHDLAEDLLLTRRHEVVLAEQRLRRAALLISSAVVDGCVTSADGDRLFEGLAACGPDELRAPVSAAAC